MHQTGTKEMMMMKNDMMIGHREALTLLVTLMSGQVFLSMPRNMALLGDTAGWLIVLLSGIFSLIGYYFLASLLKEYPGLDILQISQSLCGKYLGTLFSIIFFLFFLSISSLMLRQFAESFIISILPNTPISIVCFFFLFLLVYGAIQGIETLTRVAWFFGPYLLLAFIVTIGFSMPYADLQLLLPILGKGPLTLLKHSVFHISLFSNVILLGVIAPKIREQDKVSRIGLYSLILAIVINTLVTATVLITFNYTSTSKLVFPIFQLTRLITLGEFIQRTEAIFVFLWFFTAAILMGGMFYGTVISFSHSFGITNYRPLVFAMAILIFTISLFPSSMTETVDLDAFIVSKYYPLVTFGIPLLLWIVSRLKKKGINTNG